MAYINASDSGIGMGAVIRLLRRRKKRPGDKARDKEDKAKDTDRAREESVPGGDVPAESQDDTPKVSGEAWNGMRVTIPVIGVLTLIALLLWMRRARE